MISKFILVFFLLLTIGCTTYGPITATSHTKTSKSGKSCRQWLVLPVFYWGRNDIQAAALNGQINSIAVVDYEYNHYFLYGEVCTIVYGE